MQPPLSLLALPLLLAPTIPHPPPRLLSPHTPASPPLHFLPRQSQLLRNGVAWLDTQGGETSYWFPGLMREVSMTADSAPDDD